MNILVKDLAVPVLSRGLLVAARYCDVLAKEAATRNVSSSSLLELRLSDQGPSFGAHIDGAIDAARTGLVSLLGFPDYAPTPTDRDLAGIEARLAQTIRYVGEAEGTVFVDTDQKVEYVVKILLPAFYLHLSSAHAILRYIGAPLGKGDYLGDIDGLYKG